MQRKSPSQHNREDLVFTSYITLKNGRRLYAKQCGLKAFCFPKKERKK